MAAKESSSKIAPAKQKERKKILNPVLRGADNKQRDIISTHAD